MTSTVNGSTCNESSMEKDSILTTQTVWDQCLRTSVKADSMSNHVQTDSYNINNEDEVPDPSWFKAATILLSLKMSSEARLNGAGTSCSTSPYKEMDTHVINTGTDSGYYHHGNDFDCEEKNEVTSRSIDIYKHGFTSNEDPQDIFEEDDDDDIEKDLSNTCSLCHKVYSRPSTLKAHMRIHTGEKPFHCSICDKSFSQDANLKAHLRVHSKEKPFKCGICQRRFAQSSSVTTHMRIHSGERPYKCKVCSRGFADSSTLTKHLRIHTGEKPYQCKVCDMKFSQSGNLSRHMRVHIRKK